MEYMDLDLDLVQEGQQQEEKETLAAPKSQDTANKPVNFWAYLGMILLFAIPLIGWLACVIFMFVPENKNLKNYARAAFTWMITRVAIAVVIISLLVAAIGNFITMSINEQLGLQFQNATEMVDLVVSVMNGDYSKAIAYLQPQLISMIGEEYAPLLGELAKEEYNNMIHELMDGEYGQILNDLQNNAYPNLPEVLGEENYAGLMFELEAAANGERSELFEKIKDITSMIPLP